MSSDCLFERIRCVMSRTPYMWGSWAQRCFQDGPRTNTLMSIVGANIPDRAVVADLGSGTGCLGLAAMEGGARRAYLVEQEERCTRFLHELLPQLGYIHYGGEYVREGKSVRIVPGDACTWVPGETIDAVISETVSTGLIVEPVVRILNSARGYCRDDGQFYPSRAKLRMQLWGHNGGPIDPMTESITYADVFFDGHVHEQVDNEVELLCTKSGSVSYAGLSTSLVWPGGKETCAFAELCGILRIPLDFQEPLRCGDSVRARIRYGFGSGDAPDISLSTCTARA